MRKEKFGVGDFVHVFNRGNKKMDIVRDNNDRWRFLSSLRFYNHKEPTQYIMRSFFIERKERKNAPSSNLVRSNLTKNLTKNGNIFDWPENEELQKPIVEIVSYCLMPNHYHLLLREIIPGGITMFIKKLGSGFTAYINKKYNEDGRIFQGSYKARLITDLKYLQYVDAYIQVLNPMELLPQNNFKIGAGIDLGSIIDNPFTSLGETLGYRNFSIIDRQTIQKKYKLPKTKESYQKLIRSVMTEGGFQKIIGKLAIDIR